MVGNGPNVFYTWLLGTVGFGLNSAGVVDGNSFVAVSHRTLHGYCLRPPDGADSTC